VDGSEKIMDDATNSRLTNYSIPRCVHIVTLRAKLSGAVYCNRSCLWVCVCGSVFMITLNCMHQSSPNWVCRWR